MWALAIASGLLAGFGRVSYTDSDPRGTLLTAQALIERGTLALDGYPDVPRDHRFTERAGRKFYAYPLGTPLLAVPAVAVARLAGLDMARSRDDDRLQRVLAALSVGASAALASLLAAQRLPWPVAIVFGAVFAFGTPVMSTMGTALWSINSTVVTTLLALVLLSRFDVSRDGRARAAAIGAVLGAAFWCRPPALLLAGLVILWMLARAVTMPPAGRRLAVINTLALSAAVAATAALMFLVSRFAYGEWLPAYYTAARLEGSDRFWTALAAHLVSPSRGLLVFAPAAALAAAAALIWPRRVLQFPLAGVALAWVCLHLALVSRFPHWWGGYSYGSRLMVDAMPGVFLLLCAAAAVVGERSRRVGVLALVALVAAGAFGIWINSVQGVFNPATKDWNAAPDIDQFPGYALDWRLPQFMSTPAGLEARLRRHDEWALAPLAPNVDYLPSSRRIDFAGWSSPEDREAGQARRSEGAAAAVRFLIAEDTLRGAEWLTLKVAVGAETAADGELWFNGERLARLELRGRGPDYYVIGIPRSRVRSRDYDVLQSNVLEWRAHSGGAAAPVVLWGIRVQVARRTVS